MSEHFSPQRIGYRTQGLAAGLLVGFLVRLSAQDLPVPTFELGFAGHPDALTGGTGDVLTFDAYLTLTTRDNPSPRGAQGWSTSFGIEGGTLELLTHDGVIASTVYAEDHDGDPATPPILHDPYQQDLGTVKAGGGFVMLGLGFHTLDPNRQGGVTAMVLSLQEDKTLQPEGTQPIARVRASTAVGTEDAAVRLYFEDGFRSTAGMYVGNVVTLGGASHSPALGEVTIPVHAEPPVPFKLGDMNADGRQDISDPIFGLGYLFLGGPGPPCKKSMDLTGDNQLDISDPIFLLNFLFLHLATPREPYRQCGMDPLSNRLSCLEFPPCLP